MSERISYLLARFALLFEPISPRFISFLLRRRLAEWEEEGLISESKARIRRIGKFHYKVEVELDLTQKQAYRMLGRNVDSNTQQKLRR